VSDTNNPTVPGIDVSHFQQVIDWEAVARSGIQYCFIKATEGQATVDSRFASNWHGAAKAGILRGAYHFFHPATPAASQADLFARTVNQLQPGDLPPVLDLETPANWANIPLENRTSLALQWLNIVESRLGAHPIVYLSPAFATEILMNAPALAQFPLWVAHTTMAPAPTVPKPWNSWTFWQYTGQSKVPGIGRFVDANRFNGSLDSLKALTVAVMPSSGGDR
jgi:lysozyme